MDSTTSSLTSQPRTSLIASRTRAQMPVMSSPASSRGRSPAGTPSSSWKSWRSISTSVGLKRGSSSCACSVKPERALLRSSVTGSRISGARTRTSGLSGRLQTRKPRATNKVLAPPSCSALRAPRNSSTKRLSSSSGSRSMKTSRRCSASSACAPRRSSRLRASCNGWLRGSLPCMSSGLGSSLSTWPRASVSSSAGAATCSSSDFLPGLKLSRALRSDRSSSRRCQRASLSLGSSWEVGTSRACACARSSGGGSTVSRGSAWPSPASGAASCGWASASGRMRCMRARRTSTSSSNWSSCSSASWRAPWAMAWLKATAWPCAASVVSKTTSSCSLSRLRTAVMSSTTAVENSCLPSHRPTKAWPRVKTSSGFRCACSRQEANSSVRSRQVARPASSTWDAPRIFWPACSKLAGGSA